MAKEDEVNTAFITPCGVYCSVCMPFGLKNAGATFQRLIHKALGAKMGRNAETYINDIVLKTHEGPTLFEDLEETFAILRKVNIKLNPAKRAFRVPSGKLLGCLILQHGIEANLDKVKAIKEMSPPRNLKEIQRLAGWMASLGRFIAMSGEKALPFIKLMQRTRKFEWTPEADKAFAEMKRYLMSPPIMVAPWPCEPLLLYIAATPRTASTVLVAKRDARVIAGEKIDAPRLGLLPRRGPLCPLHLTRSRPMLPPLLSCSLREILLSLLRRQLPSAWLRYRSQSILSAPCCTTHERATLHSKSCCTHFSLRQANYVTTSKPAYKGGH
jgi:hypothetical protein